MIWTILTAVVAIGLALSWNERSAVWGGATFGLFAGIIFSVLSAFFGAGFSWATIGKGIVIGAIVGIGADLLGRYGDWRLRKAVNDAPRRQ
jgi:hypothetical protein